MAITTAGLVSAAEMAAQSTESQIVTRQWDGNVIHDGIVAARWEDWRVTAEERHVPEVTTLGAAGDVLTSLSPGHYTFAMPTRPIQETLTLEHLERAVKAPVHAWEALDPEELVEKIKAEVLRVYFQGALQAGNSTPVTPHVWVDTGDRETEVYTGTAVNGNT